MITPTDLTCLDRIEIDPEYFKTITFSIFRKEKIIGILIEYQSEADSKRDFEMISPGQVASLFKAGPDLD